MRHCLIMIMIVSICCCVKNNEQKKQIINEKLSKTNNHVINGAWYAKQHGDLIVPDILTSKVDL